MNQVTSSFNKKQDSLIWRQSGLYLDVTTSMYYLGVLAPGGQRVLVNLSTGVCYSATDGPFDGDYQDFIAVPRGESVTIEVG